MRCAAILTAVACAPATAVPTAEAVVEVEFGTIRGNLLAASREFLGIPFSPKPERFAPAVPWTDKYPEEGLDASKYSVQCWQIDPLNSSDLPMSEDCLQLNVYTPLPAARLCQWPVMLWIHGGAFISGTAMLPQYNGSNLAAAEDVVVVAINYRLGVFGFGVARDSRDGSLGSNNGVRDQALAMRWTKQNIMAFGGDPDKVTIFGESAGGQSVSVHVFSPSLSAGLFHRAIAQSGDFTNVESVDEAMQSTSGYAEALQCADRESVLDCIRKAEPEALLAASKGQGPGVVVDGDVLKAKPLDIISSRKFNKVPFVMGNNVEEGNVWVDPRQVQLKPVTAEGLRRAAAKVFAPSVATRLLQLYPPVEAEGFDHTWVLADLFSKLLFHCDNRATALALSAAGAAPWMYSWRHAPSCNYFKGAAHTTEIAFVFRQPFLDPLGSHNRAKCSYVDDEQRLSEEVSGLWAQFARDGEMDHRWPRFEAPSHEMTLKLDLGILEAFDTETGYVRATCNVLHKFNVTLPQVVAFFWEFIDTPTLSIVE